MKGVVLDILKKTPPPDKLDSEEEDEGESDEGSEAAESSAMEDLVSALGLPAEKAEAALPALKEIIRLCTRSY